MTAAHRRGPGVPGGAHRSTLTGLASAGLLLGPPGFLAFAAAIVAIAKQARTFWSTFAYGAGLATASEFLLQWAWFGNPVTFFFSGYWHWWSDPSLSLSALLAACGPAIPLGVPLGAFLGTLFFGALESVTTGAEQDPIQARRRDTVNYLKWSAARSARSNVAAQRLCSAPPLAAWIDGDLEEWRDGSYIVIPSAFAPKAMTIVGQPGFGKTEAALRVVQCQLGWGPRTVLFIDAKGTDPELPVRTAGLANGGTTLLFPDEPLAGFEGDEEALFQRLYGTQTSTEPYYDAVMRTHLRLCAKAVAQSAVRNASTMLDMLSLDNLSRSGVATDGGLGVADLRNEKAGVLGTRVRMQALADSLAGGMDGDASYNDHNVVFMQLPWSSHADNVSALSYVLGDVSHYCTDPRRKPRRGSPMLCVIDEAGSVPELSPAITELKERGRDVEVQVVETVQGFPGLGREESERKRALDSDGALILTRTPDPEPFCERAGTKRTVEVSQQLVETEGGERGSLRMAHHMKVSPDEVRSADVGEIWVISGGRYAHGLLIQADSDLESGRRSIDDSIERGRQRQPREQTTSAETGSGSDQPPPWLDGL